MTYTAFFQFSNDSCRTSRWIFLSQGDRTMFVVIKYFAKLLKITQCRSKWYPWVAQVSVSIPLQVCLCLVPFLRYSASNNGVILNLKSVVVQDYWKMVPFESLDTVSCSHSIVTMPTLSCIISEKNARYWSTMAVFSYPLNSTSTLGVPVRVPVGILS